MGGSHVDIYPGDDRHPTVYDTNDLDDRINALYDLVVRAGQDHNFMLLESTMTELRKLVFQRMP